MFYNLDTYADFLKTDGQKNVWFFVNFFNLNL